MQKGKDIVDELQNLVPGADWPGASPLSGPPAGYFNQLPEAVLQRVRAENNSSVQEELSSLSPLLANARTLQQPYSVPEGYFDGLPGRIMTGIQSAPAGAPRIVPLRRRNGWKWAVAACLVGAVSLSALLFLQRGGNSPATLDTQLAGISDQEIVDYLQTHSDAFDSEDIFSNVNNTGAPVELSRLPAALNDLPAEVIRNYIENTGFSSEVPIN